MERWAKYKDNLINVSQVSGFSVRRLDKDAVTMPHYKDMGASKSKKWLLFASSMHEALDAFTSKEDALRVAERIVKGDFDIK